MCSLCVCFNSGGLFFFVFFWRLKFLGKENICGIVMRDKLCTCSLGDSSKDKNLIQIIYLKIITWNWLNYDLNRYFWMLYRRKGFLILLKPKCGQYYWNHPIFEKLGFWYKFWSSGIFVEALLNRLALLFSNWNLQVLLKVQMRKRKKICKFTWTVFKNIQLFL